MNTEKQLQNYLKTAAKNHGIGFYKMVCAGRRGFPDVMLIYKSKIFFIELKTERKTGRLHPLQENMINELINHGATTYVTDSKKHIDVIIAELIQ